MFLSAFIFWGILVPLIIAQQQLDCNFDTGNFCNWSNGLNNAEDDFDWQTGNSVAVDGFHSIPRTVSGTGSFAYAQGRLRPSESDTARAWLRSPTIDGLPRPATLTFTFWKTAAPPVLQVCTRDAGVNQLRCLDSISGLGDQRWTRREVIIPPNPLPFQIILVATNFRTALDLVGLDDLQFRTTATNGTFADEDADTSHIIRLLTRHRESGRKDSFLRQNDNVDTVTVRSPDAFNDVDGTGRTGAFSTPEQRKRLQTLGLAPTATANSISSESRERISGPVGNPLSPADQQRILQQLQFRQRQLWLQQQQQTRLRQEQTPATTPILAPPNGIDNGLPGQVPAPQDFAFHTSTIPPLPVEQNVGIAPVVLQPFTVAGLQPEVVFQNAPLDNAFGPPLPPLPVERPEQIANNVEGPQNTHLADAQVARAAPIPNLADDAAAAQQNRFTLPPNWLRVSTVAKPNDDIGGLQQQISATGAPDQFTSAASDAEQTHAHEHGHDHEHGEFAFGICQAIACTFDSSHCHWYNDLSANFDWKLKNNVSQYQGIPQDLSQRPSYVFVSGDQRRPDQRAVIRSPHFVIPSGAYLEFYTFVTEPTVTRLSVYRNVGSDPPNVLWQTLGNHQVDKNNWQRVRVPLPASSFPMTISVVADQLSTGQYMGIDDMRLVDSSGVDISCASDTSFTSLGVTRVLLLTPFPPRAPDEQELRNDLQLQQAPSANLLSNPQQQEAVSPPRFFNWSLAGLAQRQQNQSPDISSQAFVQQRRLGADDGQKLPFSQSEQDRLQDGQAARLSANATRIPLPALAQNQLSNGNVVQQNIERQSQLFNVLEPAQTDQLQREVVVASQFFTASPPADTTRAPLADRLIDPRFPPNDNYDVNGQDSVHLRKPFGQTSRWGVESNLDPSSSLDKSRLLTLGSSKEKAVIVTTITTIDSPVATAANPDPLGFQDFVSSLTRDLQALAGGSTAGRQSVSPLNNFNYYSRPLVQQQPQLAHDGTWLQSLLGKRKRK